MIHAENGAIIDWTIKKLEEKKLFAPKYHTTSHPPVAEIEATYRAVSLSEFIDVPILIVHVSSPAAAKHISDAQKRGLPVYAETCPQYLFLTRKDLDKPGFEGAKCVCSPPPREGEQDHEGIWQGLEDGTFTVLSSVSNLFGRMIPYFEYPRSIFKSQILLNILLVPVQHCVPAPKYPLMGNANLGS